MGLLAASRRARRFCEALGPSHWSRLQQQRIEFELFRAVNAHALCAGEPGPATTERRTALLVGTPSRPLETQVWLTKALALAGFAPTVLLDDDRRHRRRYYQLAAARKTCLWSEFSDDLDLTDAAGEMIERSGSIDMLIGQEYAGARVGRVAACSAMRELRTGTLDLSERRTRSVVAMHLSAAMSCAVAAQRIVARLRPAVAIVADCDYTPLGPIFDVCLSQAIDVISYDATHKSNALIFKRHTQESRTEHRSSLSKATWEAIRGLPWSEALTQRLQRELQSGYETRDWYSQAGTQFKCRHHESNELRDLLGLDPKKKTAFIFPHISWDAPHAWGTQLFNGYDHWLVETVRAACLNDRVNWVIKVHPANVKKSALSGKHQVRPAELVTLRRHFDSLPPHIFVMPADTRVSTDSVYPIMDYCLTVRGTVGIEAAARGIPVITGGTGRYDHCGFTIDSETPEQYLERIARIEALPPLTPEQRELAQKYAYGLFVMRPLQLSSLTLRFYQGGSEFEPGYVRNESRIVAGSGHDLNRASGIEALKRWLNDPTQADFLMPGA